MTSKCIYLQGQYEAVGTTRRRGDCVEAEFLKIEDQTLSNVLISYEAFNLLELGEIIEVTYFTVGRTTYLTYVRFGNGTITETPNFAGRELSKSGFRYLGIMFALFIACSVLFPRVAYLGGNANLSLLACIGASLVMPIIKASKTAMRVRNSRNLFPA